MRCFSTFNPKVSQKNWQGSATRLARPGSRRMLSIKFIALPARLRFDNGKMRDVLFVGMPKTQSERNLTRSSLDLGTTETFLYLATLLNPDRLAEINQGGLPTGTWLQKVFGAAARAGVTVDDWKAAFDLELGSLADWPQSSRWPSIIATLPVKDFARASKVVNALTHAIDEDAAWTKTEKNGVTYFSHAKAGSVAGNHADDRFVEPGTGRRTRFGIGRIGDEARWQTFFGAGDFAPVTKQRRAQFPRRRTCSFTSTRRCSTRGWTRRYDQCC